MQYLLVIPVLLLFLYALYRLVKDDHVFIRKGISVEQSFDIAFITLWISLFMARLLYLMYHFIPGQNIFFDFFSLHNGGLSLTGAVIGGIIAVCLIGKYKRVPFGRLSDFLSLAFLYTLPVIYLANAVFVTKNELLLVFLNSIVYFIILLFFVQFLYPKILNRTMKEGMLAILFLLFYSFISLTVSFLTSLQHLQNFISLENITLILLFIGSVIVLMKQERTPTTIRRSLIR